MKKAVTSTLLTIALQLNAQMTEKEAEEIGVEAYIYGYPLVTMDLTKQVMTNVESPENNHAPLGQFYNAEEFPNASFHDVTAPNADTLYSSAWIDLSKQPYVLHVPDENGRYYLMEMLDAWTTVFGDPGTRTTGTKAADFAITGPNWKGTLPKGMKEYKSSTDLVWILGRTYTSGTPEDYKEVHALQKQYTLTPLSEYGKPYSPPKGSVNADIDMKTPVRDQIHRMSGAVFFKNLARLMKNNPPVPEDAPIIEKMAKIGIVPGKEFELNNLDPSISQALQQVPRIALEKLIAYEKEAGKIVNGWIFAKETGRYGTDYMQRALVAAIGLGANLPQDAIYPYTDVDESGQPLIGLSNYTLHFPKGQLPPVKGFWSLTLYNDEYFFVSNPLNRYSISQRDQLKFNPDGSLDIYIQNTTPGPERESNWLPSPEGRFILMLRMYWPEEDVIKGLWKPPTVQLVK